jgi:hypothetical protein
MSYRATVADVLTELSSHTGADDLILVEKVLAERLAEPELAAVLSATARGLAGSTQNLMFEIRQHCPGHPDDLLALVRNYLSSQIDAMWWEHTRPYTTDTDVTGAAELVNLDQLRRRGRLRFHYRRQARTLPGRAVRAVERRVYPDRKPRTAGLRFTHTRPEMVALLNQLAVDFARTAPEDTPPLFVTSLARSLHHQYHLRSLGYAAMLPSSHCVGYAVDIEIAWFRRFGAHQALTRLLRERQECGDANVIDEGQVWHLCVNPAVTTRLRRDFELDR